MIPVRPLVLAAALSAHFAAPAAALTCDDLVYQEAVAFSKKTPRDKWFARTSATPEDNARAWLKSSKGVETITTARQKRRQGCE